MNDGHGGDLDLLGQPEELREGRRQMWLSDLSIKQPVFITMLVLAAMVIGAMFYGRMGLDLMPDVSLPVAVVRTIYPGANPKEVERSVTKPIEDAVVSINGVDTVRSSTMDGVSLVTVEFKMDTDGKLAADEVKTRVDAIRNSLPSDVKEPMILRFDPSASPILGFAIADKTGQRSPEQLRTITDDVFKPRLEQLAGVAAVDVTGGRQQEVHIDLRLDRLTAFGISPQQVVQALKTENLDVPAGRVPESQHEETLRTAGEVSSLPQLSQIPVVTKPGSFAVKIGDVADVSQGNAEVRTISRFDGRESVTADVRKQSGTNTVQVADAVKREMAKLEKEYPDLTLAVAYDQSTFTRESVQDVQTSLLLGAILASIVVLLFFRDLRNTLVTVAGLPVIVLGTFGVLYILGLSLNMITLMALSLSVGMLIDDAIVVRENIFRHMEMGEDPKIAAGRGTAEIALAVIAMTSTIVAVFLPIAFAEGIAGKFLRDFGVTVAVAVLISLVEAFTLAPMLSAYFFRRIDPSRTTHRTTLLGRLFESGNLAYQRLLGWALRHRLIVVIVGLVTLAASLAIIPLMTFSFIPETDQGEFSVSLELKPGTRLADTDQVARNVERLLLSNPNVDHVFATVGSSDGSTERAGLTVKLRARGYTNQIIAWLRPQLERSLTGIRFSIEPRSSMSTIMGGSSALSSLRGRPIQFTVQSEDFDVLDQVSADLLTQLQQIPGTVDADRSIKPGRPGWALVLSRAKATDLGVTMAQVGTAMRTLVTGERAGTYRAGTKDIDIIVRLAESDRDSLSDILRVPILTSRGSQIPLSAVATLAEATEPLQIQRENRQRQAVVGSGYFGQNFGTVFADARSVVAGMNLPPGTTIKVSGQAKYMDEMFTSLGMVLALSVLFVYMILASQFGSFVHPFTIMLALPFSVVGALLALFAGGFSFDMLGMIGIILLMGLVSKNSILLVEFINQLRRRGLDTHEAILQAGPIRLRPILMTTLAMIFGMIPVAIGLGAGSEMRQPMGVSVIGGLITSTLLTLVVVPVAYSLIDDLSRLVARRRHASVPVTPSPQPEQIA